jgi:hypothetical protein
MVLGEELEDDLLADLGVDRVGGEGEAVLADSYRVCGLAHASTRWLGSVGGSAVGGGVVGKSHGESAESSSNERCGNHIE